TQEFTVSTAGVNRAPVFDPIPAQLQGREGQLLEVPVSASDADGDHLVYWADHLPPGAVFDVARRTLMWTPDGRSAGTYETVLLVVSDGIDQVSQSTTLVIAPTNQAPTLLRPADRTVREGDHVRIALSAGDPEGAVLTYGSNLLPGGAFLDPKTGVFDWTP